MSVSYTHLDVYKRQDLIDLDCADLVHSLDVVRAVRASGQRDQLGEVDGDFFVIDRIRVGGELHPILLAALCLQEGAGDLVGRENGCGSAQLSAHIGDGGALRNGQALDALAGILHNFANAALDRKDLQDLQDDVLRCV